LYRGVHRAVVRVQKKIGGSPGELLYLKTRVGKETKDPKDIRFRDGIQKTKKGKVPGGRRLHTLKKKRPQHHLGEAKNMRLTKGVAIRGN